MICHALSVLLANIWKCVRGNQISIRFIYILFGLKDYLQSYLDNNKDEYENNENNPVF